MYFCFSMVLFFFFFNDTATTEIYTLSLHDALPISFGVQYAGQVTDTVETVSFNRWLNVEAFDFKKRSEEHTSELQSRQYLVCRLLLEKKKIISPRPLSARYLLLQRLPLLALAFGGD